MALWVKLILAGIGLVAVGLGLAIWHGSARWQGKTSQFVENLIQAIPRKELKTVTFEDFENLPNTVAKYFRWALKEGQPLICSARIIQAGEFRARKADDGWSLFEAKQYFTGKGESLRLSMISHGDRCRDIKSA